MTLTLFQNRFLLDGNEFRILSGSMHYFRVLPEYWRDRLEKMRDFGLNTVETYVAWNIHEPRPGKFDFSGRFDIENFIRTAAEVGLKVIIRPGPYICAEWEFGGLPFWLLKDPEMQVRCSYPPYLAAVDRFFDHLLLRLAPLQSTQGGPIIAMQVENEYGSYGNDKAYLRHLVDGLRTRGIDSFLFTSDGPRDSCLQGGTLPEVYKTVNFAFEAEEAFTTLREYQPGGPEMVTEFWSGWFDHWGEAHHKNPAGDDSIQQSVDTLEKILASGASLNFYMFHGGTNFGFMNGANLDPEPYHPTITSYDYDAPLNESGDPSPRFKAYRDVLARYVKIPEIGVPAPSPKTGYGVVEMTEAAGLFNSLAVLSQPHSDICPRPMEDYDQDFGFILYRTTVSGPRMGIMHVRELHDRAMVFVDGEMVDILERETGNEYAAIDVARDAIVEILVENQGRVNFGPSLVDRKGICGGVTINDQYQYDWEIFPLPLDDLSRLEFSPLTASVNKTPGFFRASFDIDKPADTFLATPGWTKGMAWINGFNLGRYWDRGPQKTLYVPAPLLRHGRNELILFELHGTERYSVEFRDKPDLG